MGNELHQKNRRGGRHVYSHMHLTQTDASPLKCLEHCWKRQFPKSHQRPLYHKNWPQRWWKDFFFFLLVAFSSISSTYFKQQWHLFERTFLILNASFSLTLSGFTPCGLFSQSVYKKQKQKLKWCHLTTLVYKCVCCMCVPSVTGQDTNHKKGVNLEVSTMRQWNIWELEQKS